VNIRRGGTILCEQERSRRKAKTGKGVDYEGPKGKKRRKKAEKIQENR